MSAIDQLLSLAEDPDPISNRSLSDSEIEELQIAAANDRYQVMRDQIPILAQRGDDMAVPTLRSVDDIVRTLFSHVTYKSYPESFIANERWDHLLAWFETVSTRSMSDVNVDGVRDIDDWTDRLQDAGHFVFTSSGTSGKSSFIDQSQADIDRISKNASRIWGWPNCPPADNSRALFALTPSRGSSKMAYLCGSQARYYARPDAVFALTDEPIRMSEVNGVMKIQLAMADGTATPSQVAEFEQRLTVKAEAMEENYRRLALALRDHQNEVITILGGWPQHWALLEACREVGFEGRKFNPDSLFFGGGGTKGLKLPDDYREQVLEFYSDAQVFTNYGMSEVSTQSPMCESGRFHVAPWLMLIILDATGETIVERTNGVATGRAAFFDPIWDSHWGGMISGDWITADYGPCSCGRLGPTVEDSVRRARDVVGIEDDKVSCAGAVEAYIRGALKTSIDRID